MARLASWRVHQKIVKTLMRELVRKQPAEFQPVSIHQIYNADREIFLLLAERTENGLDAMPGGTFPLDKHIEAVLEEPRIKAFLNPFPKTGRIQQQGSDNKRGAGEIGSLAAENKRLKEALSRSNQKGSGKQASSKTSGKGGDRRKPGGRGDRSGKEEARLPRELQGMATKTAAGKKFCYAFNLEGCPAGRDCPKGEHRCMKPGCESSSHGARDHK